MFLTFLNLLWQFYERTRHSGDVMVYNLKESQESDNNNKKQHDLELISKLFLSILLTFSSSGIKTFCVGMKKPGTSRPLKVILNNAEDVSSIVNNFYTVSMPTQDPLFSLVKLSRDSTPWEAKSTGPEPWTERAQTSWRERTYN